MTVFTKFVRTILDQAGREAQRDIRDPQPAHLLLGILQAQVGTVPRALALAGIDRGELTGRVRQTLADGGTHEGKVA